MDRGRLTKVKVTGAPEIKRTGRTYLGHVLLDGNAIIPRVLGELEGLVVVAGQLTGKGLLGLQVL